MSNKENKVTALITNEQEEKTPIKRKRRNSVRWNRKWDPDAVPHTSQKPGKRSVAKRIYADHFDRIAYQACARYGCTDKQLADLFEVGTTTITRWKVEHDSFRFAVMEGKTLFDKNNVEKALLDSAIGYETEIRTYETVRVGKDKATGQFIFKEILKKRIVKQVPPNILACKWFLLNRDTKADPFGDKADPMATEKQELAFEILKSDKKAAQVLRALHQSGILESGDQDCIDTEANEIH